MLMLIEYDEELVKRTRRRLSKVTQMLRDLDERIGPESLAERSRRWKLRDERDELLGQ